MAALPSDYLVRDSREKEQETSTQVSTADYDPVVSPGHLHTTPKTVPKNQSKTDFKDVVRVSIPQFRFSLLFATGPHIADTDATFYHVSLLSGDIKEVVIRPSLHNVILEALRKESVIRGLTDFRSPVVIKDVASCIVPREQSLWKIEPRFGTGVSVPTRSVSLHIPFPTHGTPVHVAISDVLEYYADFTVDMADNEGFYHFLLHCISRSIDIWGNITNLDDQSLDELVACAVCLDEYIDATKDYPRLDRFEFRAIEDVFSQITATIAAASEREKYGIQGF